MQADNDISTCPHMSDIWTVTPVARGQGMVNYTIMGVNHLSYDLGALVIELNYEFDLCIECHEAMLASYVQGTCPDEDCTPEWIKVYAPYTLELTEMINDV